MSTVTHANSAATTNNGTSYVSGSFTPVVGDLLVVFVSAAAEALAAPTLTASANGITFSRSPRIAVKASSADRLYTFVANELVPSSPSAMTVTFDCTGDTANGAGIAVARVDGMARTGLSAIRQSAFVSNIADTVALTTTFATEPHTNNPVMQAVFVSNTAGTTAPTGLTEQADWSFSVPNAGGGYSSVNSGFTSKTITLGTTSHSGACAVAIELDTSAAPPLHDTFDRANGGLGSNWICNGTAITISANEARAAATGSYAHHVTATTTNFQESSIVYSGSTLVGPCVAMPLMTAGQSVNTGTWYVLRRNGSTNVAIVQKTNGGSGVTGLATSASYNVLVGDVLKLTYDGAILRGYVNDVEVVHHIPSSPIDPTVNTYVGIGNGQNTAANFAGEWWGGDHDWPTPPSGDPAFAAAASYGLGFNAAPAGGNGTLTFPFTCPPGSNMLIVPAVFGNFDTGVALSVTYDGVAMTAFTSVIHTGGSNYGFIQGYYLEDPPTGTPKNVAITSTGASGSGHLLGNAMAYYNADVPTGVVTATGTSTTAATSPTVPTGSLGVQMAAAEKSFSALSHTRRAIFNLDAFDGACNYAYQDTDTPGSPVAMTATCTSGLWASIGFEIPPAPSGGGGSFIGWGVPI